MTFQFSVREAIKKAWYIFWKKPQFFISFGALFLLLNMISNIRNNTIVMIALIVAAIVWGYVQYAIGLASVDGNEDQLVVKKMHTFFPTWQHAVGLFAVGIVVSLLIVGGLILLVLPGIYIAVRLSCARYAYVDRKEGVLQALRYSWDITEGNFFVVLKTMLASAGIMIGGIILLFIGATVTYPISVIISASLYRALATRYHTMHAIEVQPLELQA